MEKRGGRDEMTMMTTTTTAKATRIVSETTRKTSTKKNKVILTIEASKRMREICVSWGAKKNHEDTRRGAFFPIDELSNAITILTEKSFLTNIEKIHPPNKKKQHSAVDIVAKKVYA